MENLAPAPDMVSLSRKDLVLLQLAAREARIAGMLDSEDRIRLMALEAEYQLVERSPWLAF